MAWPVVMLDDAQPPPEPAGISLPLQERSWETYQRILDAAERLLGERDFESIRMEELLAEAGVTFGSFYARFQGKQALQSALVERYRQDVQEFVARPPATDAEDLEAACRAIVVDRVRRFRRRNGLMRFLVTHQRTRAAHMPVLREQAGRLNEWMVRYFLPFRDEIGHRDARQAVLTGVYLVLAICRDRVLFGDSPHSSTVPLSLARLEDELTALLVRYLRGDEV
jgi:AcrR family transcriptional regulator